MELQVTTVYHCSDYLEHAAHNITRILEHMIMIMMSGEEMNCTALAISHGPGLIKGGRRLTGHKFQMLCSYCCNESQNSQNQWYIDQ